MIESTEFNYKKQISHNIINSLYTRDSFVLINKYEKSRI